MRKSPFLYKASTILLALYAIIVAYIVLGFFFGIEYRPFFTPFSTMILFIFAVDHSSQRLGWKRALLLLGCTFIVSLVFESVGVATGWVYGGYAYTDKLGYKFLGLVPLLIPIAWFMMSYPSFIIANRLLPDGKNIWTWRLSVAAVGAVVMTAWDLAMDPMMVAGEHWVWEEPGAYFGIPLQNYLGWWLTIFVAFLLFLILGRLTPAKLATSDLRFERQAVVSYAIAGLSTIIVCLQIDLGGPALAGLFAMLPWAVMGWRGNALPQRNAIFPNQSGTR
jgi:uncharacterized membrane protein